MNKLQEKKGWKKISAIAIALILVLAMVPSVFAYQDENVLQPLGDSQILGISGFGISPFGAGQGTSKTPRDIILVLDDSGSMTSPNSTPFNEMKKSVKKFCADTFAQTTDTRIAIVVYGTNATRIVDFTTDINEINTAMNYSSSQGWTNTSSGILKAEDMFEALDLSGERTGSKKIMITLTDGMANHGSVYSAADAKYQATNPRYTGIAQDLPNNNPFGATSYTHREVERIANSTDIISYSLGFFHTLTGNSLNLAKDFTKDIGRDNYWEVTTAADLDITFEDIFQDIANEAAVIIIPDLMGSELYADSALTQKVWPPSTASDLAGFSSKFGMGVTLYTNLATEQSTTAIGNREYGANGAYKKLVDQTASRFDNRDSFFFSYDFRQSPETIAQDLETFVTSLGLNSNEKIDIVAHGNGGLIAAHYLDRGQANKDLVNVLVSVGTPLEGIPAITNGVLNQNNTSDFVANNYNNILNGLKGMPAGLKTSIPGFATLTATKRYADTVGFYNRGAWNNTISEFNKDDIDYNAYKAHLEDIFANTPYATAITSQEQAVDVLKDFDRAYFVYGGGQLTVSSVIFDTIGGKSIPVDLEFDNIGDGVVPYDSASSYGTIEALQVLSPERVSHLSNYSREELLGSNNYKSAGLNAIFSLLLINNSGVPINPITGNPYIIVRIACPVDVEIVDPVTGIVLLSNTDGSKQSSDIGQVYLLGENAEIKIVILEDNGTDYNINMVGTGEGTMDYSIRYADAANTVVERTFKEVPLTTNTVITATTEKATETISLDLNGDGNITALSSGIVTLPSTPEPSTPEPSTPEPSTPEPSTPEPSTPEPSTPEPSTVVNPNSKEADYTGTMTADKAVFIKSWRSGKAFTNTDAKTLFTKALAQNGSANTLAIRAIDFGIVEASALKELRDLANKEKVKLTIYFDTVENNQVVSRIKVNPNEVFTSINVRPSKSSTAIENQFTKFYSNNIKVVSISQQTKIDAPVGFAIKVNASKNLVFYSYNVQANSFTKIPNTKYFVDANGYVHFTAEINNSIVISEGTLEKK